MIALSTTMEITLRHDDNALLRRGVSENRIFFFVVCIAVFVINTLPKVIFRPCGGENPRSAADVTPVS